MRNFILIVADFDIAIIVDIPLTDAIERIWSSKKTDSSGLIILECTTNSGLSHKNIYFLKRYIGLGFWYLEG